MGAIHMFCPKKEHTHIVKVNFIIFKFQFLGDIFPFFFHAYFYFFYGAQGFSLKFVYDKY